MLRAVSWSLTPLVGLVCAVFAALPCAVARAAGEGSVRLERGAESSFDAYTYAPSLLDSMWMRDTYWRMRTYSPYFDTRLSWFSNAWVYQDAYAIYPGTPEESEHPDWILRDPSGNRLWVQFACGGGQCTQYAADIGNPEFRQWWIDAAKAKLAAGYRGLFIDDVNMAQRVSDGNGVYTEPLDPRTGAPMDETAWDHYMADFMAEVRRSCPGSRSSTTRSGRWATRRPTCSDNSTPLISRTSNAGSSTRASPAAAGSSGGRRSRTSSTIAMPRAIRSCSTATRRTRRGASTDSPCTSCSITARTRSATMPRTSRTTSGGATRSISATRSARGTSREGCGGAISRAASSWPTSPGGRRGR